MDNQNDSDIVPVDEAAPVSQRTFAEGTCPVCSDVLDADIIKCPRCDTLHHQECWEYNDGCAIYGCKASLMLSRKNEETALAVADESDLQGYGSVTGLIRDGLYYLSNFSSFAWYYLGLSLVALNLLILPKIMYPLVENRILRTVAFHGVLLGFFILLLARSLPNLLSQFGRKAVPLDLKLPSDYSIEEIDSLLLNCGKNINILELAGYLHLAKGNVDRAREIYQTALSIDPDNQNCAYELGRCFERLGKHDTAREKLLAAWELNKLSGTGQKARWWASLVEKRLESEGQSQKELPEATDPLEDASV